MIDLVQQATDPWLPPFMREGISEKEYFAFDAVNNSSLKVLLDKSPKHVRAGIDKATPAKGLGRVFHILTLQPHRKDVMIRVKPEGAGKGSNAAKGLLVEWMAEVTGEAIPVIYGVKAEGKQMDQQIAILEPKLNELDVEVCSAEQFEVAKRMRESVMEKTLCEGIFNDGHGEVTLCAKDPATQLLMKIRVDWLPNSGGLLCDLKSTTSVAFQEFSRRAGSLKYHMQAAFYRFVYSLVTGEGKPAFWLIAAESEPPHDSVVYRFSDREFKAGEQRARVALKRWAWCEEHDYWPGIGFDYESREYEIQELCLPAWSL